MPESELSGGNITVQRLPTSGGAPTLASRPGERPPRVPCANCGAPLLGPYCAYCGQHIADYHRSVWKFVVDFFDNAICWDNKLLRTLGPLFREPGLLTREFMRGRRMYYVHPLRLFLFTSAVCLALMQYVQGDMVHFRATPKEGDKAKKGFHVNFEKPGQPTPTDPSPSPAVAEADDEDADRAADTAAAAVRSAMAAKVADQHQSGKGSPDNALGDKIQRAMTARIKDMGEERFSRAVTTNFQQRLSWVALVLLPIFALALRAVYWRHECFYFEHLIFSLHYHTFLFLFWLAYLVVLAIAEHLPFSGLFAPLVRVGLLLPPAYLFAALRRMYGDGPKRTLVKVLVLGSLHLLAIVIGVAAVGAAAFFSVK